MKRWISIVLVICLIFSFSVEAFAAGNEEPVKRDIILMLDISDSMEGTPFTTMKQAAANFCTQLLSSSDDNRIALVVWDYDYTTYPFNSDITSVRSTIEGISLGAGTNTAQALTVAKNLMDENGRADAIKNVVLLTDGIPQHGTTTSSGQYSSVDSKYYSYANTAYNNAKVLTNDYYLYALGFFHSLSGDKLSFARKFLYDIQNAGYYEVTDPDELEFTFGEVADDINNDDLNGISFYYNGSDTATCYFTKDYFAKSAYTYDQSLGTMSLAFAMSAFGIKDGSDDSVAYQNSYKNAKKLLTDIGVDPDYIKAYGYDTKPTTDSIAAIFGKMPITVNNESYTLIPIAVRGGGYEQEWASNFTIGKTGNHDGFDAAKDDVIGYLKSFIDEQEITGPVKFWITGYSRAAATANLVAGQLDHDLWITNESEYLDPDISYDYDDIYAYCFETPAGALTKDNDFGSSYYKNIFNIINSSDPVPYVAPATDPFNFGRYGVDRFLPSAEASSNYAKYGAEHIVTGKDNKEYRYRDVINGKLHKMLEVYKSLPSIISSSKKFAQDNEISEADALNLAYVVDDFKMKKINMEIDVNWDWFNTSSEVTWIHDDTANSKTSQGVFLSNYVTILAKDFFKNRQTYVNTYQDEIREICSVAFGCTDAQLKILVDSIIDQAKNNWGTLAWSYFYNTGIRSLAFWNWGNAAEREDEALSIVSGWLNTAIREAGITNYDSNAIDSAGKDLGNLALALISNHPNYFTTAVCNGSGLGAAHYPELCFAWMASMDKNYSSSNSASFNNGSYRVIHINCEVDVNITDDAGNTVASIENEEPQEIADSSIISAINENGEKIVILPVDAEYNMEITGRADDNVNISIVEYCAAAGDFTRSVNYFDINLNAGDTLTGELPAYSSEELENSTPEGSDVDYVLKNSQDVTIPCNADLSGEEATTAYYEVTASANNDSYGYVIGGGIYQYGNFAQFEAFPGDGYEFVGWFDGHQIVSTDTIYRLCVTSDKALVANFEKEESNTPSVPTVTYYSLTFETNGGSSISSVSKTSGTVIDLSKYAPIKDGYNFVGWFRDKSLTIPVEKIVLSSNATVYAKWEKKTMVNPFVDVKASDYFYDAVLWAAENDITKGTDATHFSPNAPVTRAQVVTFLWRAASSPEPTGDASKFKDVVVGSYYEKAVAWAIEQGITNGTSETAFSPEAICTRSQVVTFLARFAGVEDADTASVFTDVKSTDYFAAAVRWAKDNKVTEGTSATTFSPSQNCTRAQVVTFLYRWIVK